MKTFAIDFTITETHGVFVDAENIYSAITLVEANPDNFTEADPYIEKRVISARQKLATPYKS